MSWKRYAALCPVVLVFLIQPVRGDADPPPSNHWIPQEVAFALEIQRPKALFDFFFNPRIVSAVTSMPAYETLLSQPNFKEVQGMVQVLEARLGTDWKSALRRIFSGGLTVAVDLSGASYLVVEADDSRILRDLHEFVLGFARGEAVKNERREGISTFELNGVTAWTFGPNEVHAIVDNRLLLANRREALEAMLEFRSRPRDETLASSPQYRSARRAMGAAAVTAYVNLKALKETPPLKAVLEQSRNPLASLLFTTLTESLRDANWLALGLSAEDGVLKLQTSVDHQEADSPADSPAPAGFAWPRNPGQGALPNLDVPRLIAGFSFYRDLHAFYAAKDELFPERTSGLIFFENMMGIFFSGLDLTEEVLAELKPEIRFVVAKQTYGPDLGTPQVQLPAFAAIFRLRHPKEFFETVEEAWQKAVGLINFTRGQQALPGLIIDRPSHAGTKFTVAYFRPPKEKGKGPIHSQYNFHPALANLGEYLILSSTEDLTRDLIDALKKEVDHPAKSLSSVHSLLEIDGGQVSSILADNRENLIRQNMLEKGNSRKKAEEEIGLLFSVLKILGPFRLDVGMHQGRPQMNLELELDLPESLAR